MKEYETPGRAFLIAAHHSELKVSSHVQSVAGVPVAWHTSFTPAIA